MSSTSRSNSSFGSDIVSGRSKIGGGGDISSRSMHSSRKGDFSSRSSMRGDMSSRSIQSSKLGGDNGADSGYEKLSPLHERLLNSLNSSALLDPIHLQITNESYYYHMRKRMGPKKHGAAIVKQNPNSLRWEAFIFKMKVREEDMEVIPKKHLVSNHKTKWQAMKACEMACRERDANPAKNKKMADIMNPEKILSTHFRISIVSSAFDHLDNLERLTLVYQELINHGMGTRIQPVHDPLGFAGEKKKKLESTGNTIVNGNVYTNEEMIPGIGTEIRTGGNSVNLREEAGAAAAAAAAGGGATGGGGDGASLDSPRSTTSSVASNHSNSSSHSNNSRNSSTTSNAKRKSSSSSSASKGMGAKKKKRTKSTTGGSNIINSNRNRSSSSGEEMIKSTGERAEQQPQQQPEESVMPLPGLGVCPPTKLKLGSIYGANMCDLELFHFFLPSDDGGPVTFMIETKTPSQWRPDLYKPPLSERTGGAHLDLHAVQIKAAAQPRGQKMRVKKLATVVDHNLLHQMELSQHHHSRGNSPAKARRHSVSPSRPASSSSFSLPLQQSLLEEGSTSLASLSQQSLQSLQNSSTVQQQQEQEKADKQAAQMADSLGLHEAVSGVKYKKLGGIYGHFFNDLSPEIRELVMSKYKDNKNLIRDESNQDIIDFRAKQKKQAQEESHQPKTTMSMMRAKQQASAVSGEYDKGTATEHDMLDDVQVSNFRMERAAIRLQRVRRMFVWHRAVKWFWWRTYGAITIQRVVRAYFGRQYAALYRSLRPRAAIFIQRSFRDSRSRVFIRVWQWLSYRLTRTVLPKIKRFIRNCFISWIARRNTYAIRIQKICRGFIGRARFYKKLGEWYYFTQVFPRAALMIQKVIRGFLGRCQVRTHLEMVLQAQVDWPATIRMQRIYRGRLAKKVLERLRLEHQCLLLLQDFFRRKVRRIWDQMVYVEKMRKIAATNIQRVYRGTLDRELYRMKAHIRWYNTKYIPAIILVQSCTRRHHATRYVRGLISRKRSAMYIERVYKDYCDRKMARMVLDSRKTLRIFKMTSIMQKYVRRWLVRIQYHRKLLEHDGRIRLAAKIIARAWNNFVLSRRYRHLLDEHRRKMNHQKIHKYIENRKELHVDIGEIENDLAIAHKSIDRLKDRIRLVEEFQAQASIRAGTVKREMSELQVEDFERGWAEALGQEYETLSYQLQMSSEELRLLRHRVKARQREVLNLQIELEEYEIDMDNMEVIEMETLESMRRSEITIIDRDTAYRLNRDIRREKSHWRITSHRRNVILRNRPRYQAIVSQTTAGRDLNYASTINFERRARTWDSEQLTQEKLLANDQRKQDEENRPKTYLEYAGPVQSTYDKIVDNSLQLLRGVTLDERARRLREQYKAREVKKRKATKGQFAALKGENEVRRAFSKK